MGNLYNTQSRMPENLPTGQIQDALEKGTHSYQSNDDINVIGPSGKLGSVKGSTLLDALKAGYKIESPFENAKRSYLEENKGLSGSAKAFLGNFADEAALGIPEIIYKKTGDPLEVAKYESLKKEHNIANALGGIAGFGASLAVGGPIFKGAAKAGNLATRVVSERLAAMGIKRGSKQISTDLVARTMENGARFGAEGLVISSPRILTELALGDPEQAAETALYGGFGGALLGAATGPLGKGWESFANYYRKNYKSSESGLKSVANEAAKRALGFKKSDINKTLNHHKGVLESSEHILNAELSDGTRLITPMSTTEEMYDKVNLFRKQSGAEMGKVYQALDNAQLKIFEPEVLANIIESEMGGFYRSPLNQDLTNTFENLLKAIRDLAPNKQQGQMNLLQGGAGATVSFDKAQELIEQIGNHAYPKGARKGIQLTEKQAMLREAYRWARALLDDAVNQGSKKIAQPELLGTIQKARNDYRHASNALGALDGKLSSQHGNNYFGLTDTIAGAGALTASGIPAAVGTIALKKGLTNYGWQTLARVANNDGLLWMEQKVKTFAHQLDDVAKAVFHPDSIHPNRIKTRSIPALREMFGSKKSRKESFDEISKVINDAAADPQATIHKISENTSMLSESGAPQIADALSIKSLKALNYLHEQLPRSGAASSLISQKTSPISDAQISQFERKLGVVLDPFSVIENLEDGTLTKDHIDAIQKVYPQIYQQMKMRIVQELSTKDELPYASRVKLSLLLGIPIDRTMNPAQIKQLQSAFISPQGEDQSPPGANKVNMSGRVDPKAKLK